MASRTQDLLMEQLSDPPTPPEPKLIELTPEIEQERPVVNNARDKKGRMQGVADFFANEHAQNALLAFGRAFDNRPGSAANTLADFGEGMLKTAANQRAVGAFEEGGNITEAGGDFADPEFMADLISQRHAQNITDRGMTVEELGLAQRIEEFGQTIGIEERMMNLREWSAENDSAIRWFTLTQDKEQFDKQYELQEKQYELDKISTESNRLYQEARTDFTRANIEHLGSDGDISPQYNALLLRAQNTLGILSEQENAARSELTVLRQALNDVESRQKIWRWTRFGFADTGDRNIIKDAQTEIGDRGLGVLDGDDLDSIHASLKAQIEQVQTRLGNTRQDARDITQTLVDAKPGALTRGTQSPANADPSTAPEDASPEPVDLRTEFPAGSPGSAAEMPRAVTSPADVGSIGDGFYRYGNTTYYTRDGVTRPVLD